MLRVGCMRIPELLAPVGSMDHLKVAVNAGASSVYLSGEKYGARKYAPNFTLEEISEAVDFAHLHNVRVYVTVNTLVKESEIEEVLNYLSRLYSFGVDAVLVQDLGLVELINNYLPDLKIHASTQLTCENQLKLDYLESKGIRRVVLPREMKRSEIEQLKTSMELEVFVHGALCYSYSGQCLMSSFKGGRSGNRGACAQPCRQKYRMNDLDEDYYLSPCDLSLYDKLKDLSELNIKCIKIEGRMRSKEYLAVVVGSYRKALNKLKSNKKAESEEIKLVFNRGLIEGGFSGVSKRSIKSGHIGLEIGEVLESSKNQIAIRLNDDLTNIPEKGDGLLIVKNHDDYGLEISQNPVITTANHFKKGKNKIVKDLSRPDKVLIVKKVWQNKKEKFNLNRSTVYLTKRNSLSKKVKEIESKKSSFRKSDLILTFSVRNNYPVLKGRLITANRREFDCEVAGYTPFEKPLKKAVSTDTVKKQLLKVDSYPYNIRQININYDGSLFIPISKLNELRRNLFEKLACEITDSYKHSFKHVNVKRVENTSDSHDFNLSFYTNNLNHLKNIRNVKRVYLEVPPVHDDLDINNTEPVNLNHMISFIKEAYEISLDKDYELIWKWPDIAHDSTVKSMNKVRGILSKMHINLQVMTNAFTGDFGPYSMNIMNNESVKSLKNYKTVTVSPELSRIDYEDIILYCESPEKVELFVQGRVELMKTRYSLLFNNEFKHVKDNYLIDRKDNCYPVHRSISGDELIIFDDSDYSLLGEVEYLNSIGYSNFSIDGRWRDDDYINVTDIYVDALNGNADERRLEKYSLKNTSGNYLK